LSRAALKSNRMVSMILRWIAKTVVVLMAAVTSLFVLVVIGLLGYFFLALAFPERMDNTGKPITVADVRAAPLPIYDPYGDGPAKIKDKEHRTVTDENGRYLFERLVASGGVKEGMWVQEYDIVVNADGYKPQKIHVRKTPKSRQDITTVVDFVLEETGQ